MTDLFPTFRFGDVDLAEYPFAVRHGSDRGKPEQLVADVQSALTDGSLFSVTSYGNREVVIPLFIQGADHVEIDENKALLVREARKARNEFVFNSGDGFAEDLVYDTFEADLSQEYDDTRETNNIRFYTLTFKAHPWPRSATKVITPAVATTSSTVVNDGSSGTGWTSTGPVGAVVSVVSGAVVNTYAAGAAGSGLRLAGPVDMTTAKFIAVDWKSSVPVYHGFWVNDTASQLTEVRREPLAAGYSRSWYKVAASVTSLASLTFVVVHSANAATATLSVDQVLKSETLPISGTARQLSRVIDPDGSIAAEGDVIVQHETAGLGQAIVYTSPTGGGYNPALSQWRTNSNTPTPDASTVSGQRISMNTIPVWYDVPVDALPKGDAQLWARVRLATGSPATAGIFYGVRSVMGGVELDADQIQTLVSFPVVGAWVLVPLARTILPPKTLGPSGKVRFYLLRSTVHDIELDEAWLFGMDDGRLTVVDCGTGTPSVGTVHNRLRISAPSLDLPFGRIEIGTAPDWSDAYTPDASKVGCDQTGHRFDPDGSLVTTITSGATDAAVSLEHYPRFH